MCPLQSYSPRNFPMASPKLRNASATTSNWVRNTATSASSPGASDRAFLAFLVRPERQAAGSSTTGYRPEGPAMAGETREPSSDSG
jgi:hypothetical protein